VISDSATGWRPADRRSLHDPALGGPSAIPALGVRPNPEEMRRAMHRRELGAKIDATSKQLELIASELKVECATHLVELTRRPNELFRIDHLKRFFDAGSTAH
jgi:hypothetical protein